VIRRVVRSASELEAFRETRPAVTRRFEQGTVLNVLQWVNPATARFTVEGEGIESWCCPQELFEQQTEAPVAAMESTGSGD
jgi:hypothetical protein